MSSAQSRRPRHRGPISLLALLGVLVISAPGSALAAGPVAATGPRDAATLLPTVANSGTILPGVHVGSIDLSGLDETSARQVLGSAFAYVTQGQVTVVADAATTSVTYASISRRVDIDALIDAAFAVGRNGSPMQQLTQVVHVVTTGYELQPTVALDENALTQRLAAIAAASAQPMVNARAIRTKTGFSTVPGRAGRAFDGTGLLPQLIVQLKDISAPATIAVGLTGTDVPPAITDEAAQAASAGAAAMDHALVLANGGETWTIPQNVVHSWINFKVVDGTSLQIAPSDALIQKALTSLAPKIKRDPVPASWAFEAGGVTVIPSKDGRTIDVPRTSRRIQLFLQGRAAGTIPVDKKLGPTVVYTKPNLTTEQATAKASKFKLLSSWTTYFQPAAHNGYGANIWVPAGYLDNQVVQPGQTFSFWSRVGEVSLARGYRIGGAIVGGHTQEGVALAGGICSTSTTLFNAALRAGFKMGERSNHYYYIKRYPVGLDATVSKNGGGGQDMTWTNDTPYPVLIKSFKTSGSVTFSLFGIPSGRVVTFSNPIITNYVRATQEVIPTSTLPTGRLVRIEYPDDGFNALVTRFVRDSKGKLIDQRTYFSHYSMVRGVQYIGDPLGKPLVVPSYAPGAQGG